MIGYGAATPLGRTFAETWARAVRGEAGFRKVTRCRVESVCDVVGEIPDWDPLALDFVDAKEVYNWNAAFVILTMAVCREALAHAGLPMNDETGPRTACLIGSAINGADAFRTAMVHFQERGPLKISPYLLPNLCANLPSGKAGMLLGFTGPIFSPQGACASGNHAIGIGARMIRDGDCDFVLAGGVDTPILPEIIHGFTNMNATIKVLPEDRAYADPSQASRPFSIDRRGFVLSEGAGVIVLAAEEMLSRSWAYGRGPRSWGSAGPPMPIISPNPTPKRSSGRSGRRSTMRGSRLQISSTSTPTAPPRRRAIWSRSTACGRSSGSSWRRSPSPPTNPRSAIPWGPRRPSRTP